MPLAIRESVRIASLIPSSGLLEACHACQHDMLSLMRTPLFFCPDRIAVKYCYSLPKLPLLQLPIESVRTMPTYRSVKISLVSQFDILTIPEYAPPACTPSTDPFISSPPSLVDPSRSLVSVYVPTYPCSRFWVSYSIFPPHPPGLFYYFKMFLNGDLVVSWGCGEVDGHAGKTMFGLYAAKGGTSDKSEGEGSNETAREVESRVLCFGSPVTMTSSGRVGNLLPEHLKDVMEIRVYRSNGRRRIAPQLEVFNNPNAVNRIQRKWMLPRQPNSVE